MKNYNKLLLLSFFGLISFVILMNYLIDPLNVFHTKNIFNIIRPCIDKNQRISKIPAFKKSKDKIYAVWIGSSKTGECTNSEYEEYLLGGKKIANMAINGGSFLESYNMAKNVMLIHPEIKVIYFGVDFHEMRQRYSEEPNNITKTNTTELTKAEVLPLLLSYKMCEFSISTIFKNLKYKTYNQPTTKSSFDPNDTTIPEPYDAEIENNFRHMIHDYQLFYKDYELDMNKFAMLKDLIDEADKKGIKIITFGTTMHATERIVIKNTNNLKNFNKFKQELVKIQPYYDFAEINKYTTENVGPNMKYFMDSGHAYPYLRKKMTTQLIKHNQDFGRILTKNNVNFVLKQDNKNFIKFLEENPHLIKKVEEWSK